METNMIIDIVLIVVAQVFAAGAIYGAIRSDIKAVVQDAAEAKDTAKQAHQRIDSLLMKN